MHAITDNRSRFLMYFSWLMFVGTLFIITEVLRNAETIRFFHLYWLDVAATYALLGSLGMIVAVAGTALLIGFEALARQLKFHGLAVLAQGTAFACFAAVWLNLARLLLAANGLRLSVLSPFDQLVAFFVVGLVGFLVFNKPLANWMVTTEPFLRPISGTMVVLCVLLTAYLFLEPLNRGSKPAPITLIDPGRKLPNIIVIVLDSLTSRDMSLYGYHLPTTPNLDRITKTWTVYESAHSTGTGTLAMMPTLFTGRIPYTDEWYRYGDWARSDDGWLSLPQALQDVGYETVIQHPFSPGFYHLHTGLNVAVAEHHTVWDMLNRTTFSSFLMVEAIRTYFSRDNAYAVASRAESFGSFQDVGYDNATQYFRDWVSKQDRRPFFAYYHMTRPHFYYLGNEYMGTFLPFEDGLLNQASQMQYLMKTYTSELQPTIDKLRLRYNENILKADADLGKLIELLQQLGLYDQSLVIVTADHGTSFSGGFQGYYSPFLFASEHAVPLLVKYPGQHEGRRITGIVSNVDIAPTILDVLGMTYPVAYFDGRSLLTAGNNLDRVVYVRRPNPIVQEQTFAVLSNCRKLVQRGTQRFLFDLEHDPEEKIDLFAQQQSGDLSPAIDAFQGAMADVISGRKMPALLSPSAAGVACGNTNTVAAP